ncbi:copper-binding protein [Halomonas sp. NO4]|uniref:copper-binding protein n=1 Tax=Halomonas sp. NO4 TaxID=2484813 RepID=UPI0013D75DD2|nr:copper-binding protein [Halomonas sp. NO4]
MKPSLVLAGLAMAWLAVGAHPVQASEPHGHAAESAEAAAGPHTVHGIFLGYDEKTHRVTIAHEATPDVMMAMRMRLALPESEPAPSLSPGDKVRFQMFSRVETGRTWHARELEPLPDDTELALPQALRDKIGH